MAAGSRNPTKVPVKDKVKIRKPDQQIIKAIINRIKAGAGVLKIIIVQDPPVVAGVVEVEGDRRFY